MAKVRNSGPGCPWGSGPRGSFSEHCAEPSFDGILSEPQRCRFMFSNEVGRPARFEHSHAVVDEAPRAATNPLT